MCVKKATMVPQSISVTPPGQISSMNTFQTTTFARSCNLKCQLHFKIYHCSKCNEQYFHSNIKGKPPNYYSTNQVLVRSCNLECQLSRSNTIHNKN